MDSKAVLVLLVTLVAAQNVQGAVWEFGKNSPLSVVVSENIGKIRDDEKIVTLQLYVPECHTLEYVRIQINNPTSTPTVRFKKLTKEVTVIYRPVEMSESTFKIIVKGKPYTMERCQEVTEQGGYTAYII